MEQTTDVTSTRALDKVVRIDEAQVQAHLSEMVRSSVDQPTFHSMRARLSKAERRPCQSASNRDAVRHFSAGLFCMHIA